MAEARKQGWAVCIHSPVPRAGGGGVFWELLHFKLTSGHCSFWTKNVYKTTFIIAKMQCVNPPLGWCYTQCFWPILAFCGVFNCIFHYCFMARRILCILDSATLLFPIYLFLCYFIGLLVILQSGLASLKKWKCWKLHFQFWLFSFWFIPCKPLYTII